MYTNLDITQFALSKEKMRLERIQAFGPTACPSKSNQMKEDRFELFGIFLMSPNW